MILDINNTLGYSVINGRLKLFVKKGIISSLKQQNLSQQNTTQNQIVYYAYPPKENSDIFRNIVTSIPNDDKSYTVKITTSDNKVGKVSINQTKRALTSANIYIESFCEVNNLAEFRDKSPDAIKLISDGEAKFENGNWILTKKPVVKYE